MNDQNQILNRKLNEDLVSQCTREKDTLRYQLDAQWRQLNKELEQKLKREQKQQIERLIIKMDTERESEVKIV